MMEKIKSFQVDHTKIGKGMFVSRVDGDIVTYDLRMVLPNTPPYLENDGIHTFEHLFATFARNSKVGTQVVYVGPMGCRTGFYLLTRSLSHKDALEMTRQAMDFVAHYTGEVPGNSLVECGNYLDHNLSKAKAYAADLGKVLDGWTVEKMEY